MTRNVNHTNRLYEIQTYPDGPKFLKPHSKQENVWAKQYDTITEQADPKKYPAVGEEIFCWKEGIKKARETAISLGIDSNFFHNNPDLIKNNSNEILKDSKWFFQLFGVKECEEIIDEMLADEELFADNQGEEPSISNASTEVNNSDDNDSNGNLIYCDDRSSTYELLDEARLAISKILPVESEEGQSVSGVSEQKISSTINVPDYGRQYKATLVKLLNEDGDKLLRDRLVRVRQHNSQIKLFEDYAFFNNDRMSIGRVLRMRKKLQNGFVDYRNAVDFIDLSLKSLHVIFNKYETVKKGKTRNAYVMSNLSTETTADEIFSVVNFDVAENNTVYPIDNDELIELDKEFSEYISSKKTKNNIDLLWSTTSMCALLIAKGWVKIFRISLI